MPQESQITLKHNTVVEKKGYAGHRNYQRINAKGPTTGILNRLNKMRRNMWTYIVILVWNIHRKGQSISAAPSMSLLILATMLLPVCLKRDLLLRSGAWNLRLGAPVGNVNGILAGPGCDIGGMLSVCMMDFWKNNSWLWFELAFF